MIRVFSRVFGELPGVKSVVAMWLRAPSLLLVLALAPRHLVAQSVLVPVVYSVSGCANQDGPVAVNCSSNELSLTIVGANLAPAVSVFNVTGGECIVDVQRSSDWPVQCRIPAIRDDLYSFPPSPLYLSVYNLLSRQSNVPVPYVVPYVTPPIIVSSVSGCMNVPSEHTTTGCDLSSSIITFSGSGFLNDYSSAWLLLFTTSEPVLDTLYLGTDNGFTIVDQNTATLELNQSVATVPLSAGGRVNLTLERGYRVISRSFSVGFVTSPNNSAPGPPDPITPTVSITILSVRGCQVNNDNMTSGCTGTGDSLTIMGSGFPSSIGGVVVSVGPVRCFLPTLVEQVIVCTLYNLPRYAPRLNGTVWPVIIQDLFSGVSSAPFMGLQLVSSPLPAIWSISGCQGPAGLAIDGCSFADVLIIRGVGFTSERFLYLAATEITTSRYVASSLIVNDSVMIIPLKSSVFDYLQTLPTVTNLTVAFSIVASGYSNPALFTFSVLSVEVTGLTGTDCQQGTLDLSLVDCYPAVTVLTLSGTNFFSQTLTVLVGGELCSHLVVSFTSVQCTTPLSASLQPGFAYDIKVLQDDQQLILSSAISFTARPTIASVSSRFCPCLLDCNVGTPANLRCGAGDVLTITGSFFSPSSSLACILSAFPSQYEIPCMNVSLVSPNSLTCTLPTLTPELSPFFSLSSGVQLRVYENASSFSNSVLGLIYQLPSAPVLSAVTGCLSSAHRQRHGDGLYSWPGCHAARTEFCPDRRSIIVGVGTAIRSNHRRAATLPADSDYQQRWIAGCAYLHSSAVRGQHKYESGGAGCSSAGRDGFVELAARSELSAENCRSVGDWTRLSYRICSLSERAGATARCLLAGGRV